MSTLDMSFAEHRQILLHSGSAKAKFSDSSNHTEACTIDASSRDASSRNPPKRGRDFRAKAPAQALLDANRFDEFRTAFGDSFSRGRQTGGEFYWWSVITSMSSQQNSGVVAGW